MLARVITARLSLPISSRAFAIDETLKQKGAGDERSYFDKQDKAALKELLAKMEKNVKEEADVQAIQCKQEERLNKILTKYGAVLPDALTEDLLKWKRGQH